MTAAPKTVAFGVGTLIQSRQSGEPSATGDSEGGLAGCRGLKGSVKGLPLSSTATEVLGTWATSYSQPWQPWPLLNKQPSLLTNTEGGNPPQAPDEEGRILAPILLREFREQP